MKRFITYLAFFLVICLGSRRSNETPAVITSEGDIWQHRGFGPEFWLAPAVESGWPMRYRRAIEHPDYWQIDWYAAGLLSDVCIGLLLAGALLFARRHLGRANSVRSFSLCSLMVAVACSAIPISVYAWELRQSRMERRYATHIGHSVELTWSSSGRTAHAIALDASDRIDVRMRRFSRLRMVSLFSEASPATQAEIGHLPDLEALSIIAVTSDKLSLPKLHVRGINLSGSRVARRGLDRVFGLELLSLSETHADDDLIRAVAANNSETLNWLNLDFAKISEASFRRHIPKLRKLRFLSLRGSVIGNDSLEQIGRCLVNLEILDLSESTIAQDSVRDLRRLPSLTQLRLSRIQVREGSKRMFLETVAVELPRCRVDWD